MRVGNHVRYTWKEQLSDELGKVFAGVLILQTLLAVWFSGAIIRNEQSLYLWVEFGRHAARFGTGDAIFGAILYVAYYCFFWEVGYVLLCLMVKTAYLDSARVMRVRLLLLLCAVWFPITLLVFGNPILQFTRNLPTEIMGGWLLILWLCVTAGVSAVIKRLIDARRANETREHDANPLGQ